MSILYAAELKTKGFCVLPRWPSVNLNLIRADFRSALKSFPEFKHPVDDYVLGGFAALGNPASFHNPFVRKIREWQLHQAVQCVFSDDQYYGFNVEKLFDRMLYRAPGKAPSPESWHRDEAPSILPSDSVYGGWTNLGIDCEYFSCVPRTHTNNPGRGGFAKISKTRSSELRRNAVLVRIKPGQTLIFNENLIHEVRAKRSKYHRMRVFCAFRVTKSFLPLQPLYAIIRDQGVPMLKSEQKPPMYARLHWTNWIGHILDFSRYVVDAAKEERSFKSGTRKGEVYHIVQRHMASLRDMGLPLYPAYTEREEQVLRPNTRWFLLPPGDSSARKDVTLPWHVYNRGKARPRPRSLRVNSPGPFFGAPRLCCLSRRLDRECDASCAIQSSRIKCAFQTKPNTAPLTLMDVEIIKAHKMENKDEKRSVEEIIKAYSVDPSHSRTLIRVSVLGKRKANRTATIDISALPEKLFDLIRDYVDVKRVETLRGVRFFDKLTLRDYYLEDKLEELQYTMSGKFTSKAEVERKIFGAHKKSDYTLFAKIRRYTKFGHTAYDDAWLTKYARRELGAFTCIVPLWLRKSPNAATDEDKIMHFATRYIEWRHRQHRRFMAMSKGYRIVRVRLGKVLMWRRRCLSKGCPCSQRN